MNVKFHVAPGKEYKAILCFLLFCCEEVSWFAIERNNKTPTNKLSADITKWRVE
jgi:hypothetical protein